MLNNKVEQIMILTLGKKSFGDYEYCSVKFILLSKKST